MGRIGDAQDAIRSVRRRMGRRRLSILGRRDVGKTALRHMLLAADPHRAGDADSDEPILTFSASGKVFEYKMLNDVPGDDSPSFKQWKRVFDRSDRVIYIFRTDLLMERDTTTVAAVKLDIDRMRSWMNERSRSTRSVTLLGTWAGDRAVSQDDNEKLRDHLAAIDPFKLGLIKLDKARLVVGDLLVDPNSVLDEVRRGLV